MLSKNSDQIQLAKYLDIWKIFGKALAKKKRKGPWELLWSLMALQPREPSPVHHRHQGIPAFISDYAQRTVQKRQAGSLLQVPPSTTPFCRPSLLSEVRSISIMPRSFKACLGDKR